MGWDGEEKTLVSVEIKPDTLDLGRWLKILVTMVKNFVNHKWLPSGAKFH